MRTYKLSKKDQKLKTPLEYNLIKLTSLALTTFLVTLFAASLLAPVQTSKAESSEILLANQATGGSVSLSTSGTISLSMLTSATSSVRTVQDTVKVTSGSTGYQLYLSTNSEENALVRDGSPSDTIPAGGGDTILSPATLTDNTWGFAVAKTNTTSGSGSEDVITTGFDESYPTGDNSTAESKFTKVPTKGNEVLIAKRAGTAMEVTTNIYYGARVNTAKPSGLYKNTITYTAIGNGSASGLASVDPTSIPQTGGVTITISTPSTLGDSSIGTPLVTVGGETCTDPAVTRVETGSTLNLTCTAPALAVGTHEVNVYLGPDDAREVYTVADGLEYTEASTPTAPSLYSLANGKTMQELTVDMCEEAAIDTLTSNVTVLIDSRDGNAYRVAKLADGNCWMVQNMRLGADPGNAFTAKAFKLTSANSDVRSDFEITTSNIQTSGTTSWGDNEKHIYLTGNTTYGNYYNWYTATGGSTSSGDAGASICPKSGSSNTNWTLPPNTGNGSYTTMFQSSGIVASGTTSGTSQTSVTDAMQAAPYSFPLPGVYSNGAKVQGESGNFWSRTARSVASARRFGLSSNGSFDLQYSNDKSLGNSVRCVLVVTPKMQDFTVTACNNLATAETITLRDARDDNEYTVAKLADGNCWMTSNLRLGADPTSLATPKPFTLTSADSDVTENFSVAISDIQTSGTNSWSGSSYYDNHIYLTGNASYGNYYNWHTVTAGSGTLNDSSAIHGDAAASICPSSGTSGVPWKLPPNSGEGSYYNLFLTKLGWVTSASGTNVTYFGGSSSTIGGAPYSFPLSGGYYQGASYGSFAIFWSRTINDNNDSPYGFEFNNSGRFNLQNGDNELHGLAARCVLVASE